MINEVNMPDVVYVACVLGHCHLGMELISCDFRVIVTHYINQLIYNHVMDHAVHVV